MSSPIILLTIPGLRDVDLAHMPNANRLFQSGDKSELFHSFPCVTWPSQAHLLTGKLADQHGVVANGFYWRDSRKVEMWTAWNDKIERPQIWDMLHEVSDDLTSSAWFPMLSKGSGADVICMPAPIHKPDGSEQMWCYTRPQDFYGELLQELGPFPLHHFWGPLANIKSTAWIADSAALAAARFQPHFNYIYLPHLDYAAQKLGPDSDAARQAVVELDQVIGKLEASMNAAYQGKELTWIIASEYVITEVDHVCYPNRILRDEGLLTTVAEEGNPGTLIDFEGEAWALVDHQFSHVFVKDGNPESIAKVVHAFTNCEGIDEVLAGSQRSKYNMDHARSGDVILISSSNSWQAYYWWHDDAEAPSFARTVDIHRKPGYDPVELHFDPATKSIPLDASLIGGSHGAPAHEPAQRGVLLCSQPGWFANDAVRDIEIASVLMKHLHPG